MSIVTKHGLELLGINGIPSSSLQCSTLNKSCEKVTYGYPPFWAEDGYHGMVLSPSVFSGG